LRDDLPLFDRQFNTHSLATAILCDLIVQNVRTQDSGWAFAAGLLHDIGLLLIAAAFLNFDYISPRYAFPFALIYRI